MRKPGHVRRILMILGNFSGLKYFIKMFEVMTLMGEFHHSQVDDRIQESHVLKSIKKVIFLNAYQF